jgi:hypothetical protein
MTKLTLGPIPKQGTHVMIVGVGSYTHVPDGEDPRLVSGMGLTQLTSPPISAKALATWFLTRHRSDLAPLASVELLLSPSQSFDPPEGATVPIEPATVPIEPATMANIAQAFNGWYERCDSHTGNHAIFYFCGHGIEKGNLALLAEDFGANPNMLFANAFDFNLSHRAMYQNRAKLQFFIADACRSVPREVLDLLGFNPPALKDPVAQGQAPEDAPRLFATGPDDLAWGRSNQPTLFAEAFLRVLEGIGSRRAAGDRRWQVTTGRIGEATATVLAQMSLEEGTPRQQCRMSGDWTGRTAVHDLSEPPMVPVVVGCDPSSAADCATFELTKGSRSYRRDPEPGEWKIEVPADVYDLRASFSLSQYRPCSDEVWAEPPDGWEVTLAVGS